ncbi:MAG: hypothetical protein HY898_00985 [Deltaproteobacteria bacterium]|nr:hypothetical protein [Deltaproteobacteria bacterium]
MNTKTLAIVLLTVGLATASWTREAAADGLLIGRSNLSAQAAATLQTQVRDARATQPRGFEQLAQLRARLPELDARKRGRYPLVGMELKALGVDGLMPMLEEIALNAAPRGTLSDAAWSAWRAGLVEAVGGLRDPRAEPVLAAVLDSPVTDPLIVEAAAAAYGKLATDAVAARLVALSRVASSRQMSILSGMGNCRRTVVADRLAEAMAAASDDATARALARALGDVGSAWAWKSAGMGHLDEEQAVRGAAARALVAALPLHGPDARLKITAAVLVVDHPSTLALIDAEKAGASPDGKAALDELARRFSNSPFHR